ncbi:DUF1800 domain-containing protein [Terriglobus aquaticus]|uniref:DUF1800 domain-containing protein n=1 Tax=Terriglobus aquaticus TaxID=940139 RepID=A0ABW9KJG1_9BACT|nr:DUF1800 domain-containing protein [Terriglobus aquaticus]
MLLRTSRSRPPQPLRPRAAVSLALAALYAFSPMLAVAAAKPATAAVPVRKVDAAALVLNRFSFGARPGDLARVRSLGAYAWFEQQLQPDRLDDSGLEQRLNAYPAMRMSQADQIARYPTPGMVRNAAKNGYLPADPELRAILSDQVEFYQMRKEAAAMQTASVTPAASLQSRPGDIQRGFNALDEATADSMAKTGTRSQLAGGGTSASTALDAQKNAAPPNLEQATAPLPQDAVNALLALPPQDRYQRLLRMSPAELIGARKGVKGDASKLAEGMTPLQKETLAALAGTNRMISGELFSTRLLRDIYSERQLEAVMTDFWLNHFNVYIRKDGEMPSLLPEYEDTIRTHALGRFEDLLEATAKSPAMLLYLDNAQSVGPDSLAAGRPNPKAPNAKKPSAGLNENYARELMELHTLGVNGGYTQKDVTEVAKVFTGWGIERPGEGGAFLYNDRRHEPGEKTVLGRKIKESGESEGEEVLHILATSPATAHFISLELAERFVSDTPPPALVDRMAQTFLKSNGDIRAVLRTMVHAPEFLAPQTVNAKIKTPLEYVVSAVRASGANVGNPVPLAQSLERLGMPLYGCQPPTGYKWDAETWLNSAALVTRMNFALLLAANKINGTTVDTGTLIAASTASHAVPQDPGADESQRKEAALESQVLPQGVSAQTRAAVLSQTDDTAVQQAMRAFGQMPAQERNPGAKQIVNVKVRRDFSAGPPGPNLPPADKQGAVMLGLLLGSPEFQRR